jgi:gliding motility-associated-like protein
VKKIILFLFVILSIRAFATHERAGEITFRWVGNNLNDYTYELIVTTYTKVSGVSQNADRCFLPVDFGDGTPILDVCRSNYEAGDPIVDAWGATCSNATNKCSTHHMGEWNIGSPTLQSLDVKKNVYKAIHTYPGPGTYIISMTDANRNEGVVNIPGGNMPFSIQSTLIINPFLGRLNNSPTLSNPPIDRACSGKLFIHNVGASDIDGDSLSYKIGICYNAKNAPVPGYYIPTGVAVDAISGDFTWKYPPASSPKCDEYNFAIDIDEWRKIGDSTVKIGTTRRDMQVTVCSCVNTPPAIADVKDTCVIANTNLTLSITVTDADGGIKSFTASGGPFNEIPPATFSSNAPIANPPDTGVFNWKPTCNQVRLQPYLVTLKANDDGAPDPPDKAVPLSDFETFFITVKAPPVTILKAVPACNTMNIHWKAQTCNPVSNPLLKYILFRKTGCDTLKPNHCEMGVPSSWGYTQIGTASYKDTVFADNTGLVQGLSYAYRVVAVYLDGSMSYASSPLCAKVIRDVPILTHVDVISTGANGAITVKWVLPLANASNYDTTAVGNGGAYKLDLFRATGTANPSPPAIATYTSPYFSTLSATTHTDFPLNTQATPYTYKLDFLDASNERCPTRNASSIFLSCTPNDNQLKISWQVNVPWINYRYDVYKLNGTAWDSIATTKQLFYTDTSLVNGKHYCYKVKSVGAYPDTTLPSPLINWSQELCCTPVDLTPPCPLLLNIDTGCAVGRSILKWNNPNTSCSDDAKYYILYFKAEQGKELKVLDTIHPITLTTYTPAVVNSIAGCYAVTAVDSSGNESALSNVFCVDNCPAYELPNVFTPNNDNFNNLFTPLHPYRYVKDIDLKIYNRWGVEVFSTTHPDILWDGKNSQTKTLCSDGVYYYVCVINDIRLSGIVPRVLTGNIHLLRK